MDSLQLKFFSEHLKEAGADKLLDKVRKNSGLKYKRKPKGALGVDAYIQDFLTRKPKKG